MKVKIIYGDKNYDKKSLYNILANVIIKDIEKKQAGEDKNEENSIVIES